MSDPIRLMIVDDHPVVRDGLCVALMWRHDTAATNARTTKLRESRAICHTVQVLTVISGLSGHGQLLARGEPDDPIGPSELHPAHLRLLGVALADPVLGVEAPDV